ncbi:MAG: hypothetical protein B7Z63_04055 [Ignavibacteriae bacterium 37-53-5]|nr:MAG: hypothetical protein B7Z63_04055 [Ignavibacteriae bacterium 37-53-5]
MKVGMLILAQLVFLMSGLPGISPRTAIIQPEGGRLFRGPTWTADSSDSSKAPPPYTSEGQLRVFVNKAFNVGEKLKYDIYYGPIVAGSATIETPSMVYYKGRKCYKVEFTMRSAPFFDFFFKVRDYYYSLIDAKGIFPWKFEQHVREGGYKRDFVATFDQCNHTAKTSEGGPYVIQPYTQDAVSSFFFARTLDYDTLRPGAEIHFSNFYKDKVYPLDVRYLGKENIRTKAGRFHCQVIEPVIVKGGLFKNTGKITVWVTDDSLKLPVKVKTEVVIGSVVAELSGFSGLAGVPTAKY